MNWIGNTLLALVAGSVGSLLFVPVSQRLGEAAKSRYTTERQLHGTLCAYRQELAYQHGRSITEQHGYPLEFAELKGQETLAETVLRGLPDLAKRKRKQLREDLHLLVGPTMLAFAESRMYIPAAVRTNETERGRLELLLRRVNLEPDRYSEGHLQRLLSEQNHQPEHNEHYQSALTALDRMVGRVAP